MNAALSQVSCVRVSKAIIDAGQHHLREVGRLGNEGLVLWAGLQRADTFEVRELIVPQQQGIRTSDGVCVVVPAEELHRLNVRLFNAGLILIAQIHSHPGRAYHSDMDDEYAIARAIGSFSIVIPDFGRRDFALDDCAIYRLQASGRWKHVSAQSATKLIVITA